MNPCNDNYLCFCVFQLCVSVELHETGPVGDRLRDGRQTDPTDHSTEQISMSGLARWAEGKIVSNAHHNLNTCHTLTHIIALTHVLVLTSIYHRALPTSDL